MTARDRYRRVRRAIRKADRFRMKGKSRLPQRGDPPVLPSAEAVVTDQVGVAAAEQYPVKGRLDPSTKRSLPGSRTRDIPEMGGPSRVMAEAQNQTVLNRAEARLHARVRLCLHAWAEDKFRPEGTER